MTFRLNRGEKIALVGHNGAGKTTLVKLLLRFYDVTSGAIRFHDKDMKDYNVATIRNRIGVVFRDFQNYTLSIAKNILLRPVRNEEDEQIVWNALRNCGPEGKVRKLKNGIHTVISKEFDEDGTFFQRASCRKWPLIC